MAKKFKHETGGLQEKKIHVEPTREEIIADRKAEKAKAREKAKERRANRVGFFGKMREVFGELKKVIWPTFAKTVKQTGVVLGVVAIFALVVFGIDQGLGQLFKLLTKGLAE